MKKHTLISVAASLLIAGTTLYANPAATKPNEQKSDTIHSYWAFGPSADHLTKQQLDYFRSIGLIKKHHIINKEINKLRSKTPKAPVEVTDGLLDTIKAIAAIEKKETKTAEHYLEKATASFDKALKKDPALKLVPVDVDINVIDHAITLKDAKVIRKDALKLLKDNEPQETMDLLAQLRNQISITTTYLPMELYPKATKSALEALKKGEKPQKALLLLAEGLQTMVSTEVIIPVSVLVAENAIDEAAKLPKTKKKEVAMLIDLAQNQLELAQYEGYLGKYSAEYEALSKEIKVLKKKAGEEGLIAKDFDKIKSFFHTLSEKMHKEHKKSK